MQTSSVIYSAPWAEPQPDGSWRQYGPTAETYQRQIQRYRQWAYRKPPSRESCEPDAEAIRALLLDSAVELPRREREVGEWIYIAGRSTRWVARRLKLSRRTVRTHMARLAART